jgi:hypothetical protein
MSEKSMALPIGKTCADCAHVRRCTMFGFARPTDTTCDFAPSRFTPRDSAPLLNDAEKGGGR